MVVVVFIGGMRMWPPQEHNLGGESSRGPPAGKYAGNGAVDEVHSPQAPCSEGPQVCPQHTALAATLVHSMHPPPAAIAALTAALPPKQSPRSCNAGWCVTLCMSIPNRGTC